MFEAFRFAGAPGAVMSSVLAVAPLLTAEIFPARSAAFTVKVKRVLEARLSATMLFSVVEYFLPRLQIYRSV